MHHCRASHIRWCYFFSLPWLFRTKTPLRVQDTLHRNQEVSTASYGGYHKGLKPALLLCQGKDLDDPHHPQRECHRRKRMKALYHELCQLQRKLYAPACVPESQTHSAPYCLSESCRFQKDRHVRTRIPPIWGHIFLLQFIDRSIGTAIALSIMLKGIPHRICESCWTEVSESNKEWKNGGEKA